MDHFANWNNWLGRNMFFLVLLALFAGFAVKVNDSPEIRTLVIALFAYMTLVTAMETSLKQFVKILSRPWISLWALLLVHIATPVIAWSVGYLFFPEDAYIRIGYLIGASIPVGVTAVIWTSLVNGDVALSLVTVTLDTLITPVLLPAFFLVTVGQDVKIDYGEMALQLLAMITIPSLVGMVWHDSSAGRIAVFAKSCGGFTAKLAFLAVILINAAMVGPAISWSTAVVKMALVTLFMVGGGYLIGYAGSFAIKGRSRETTLAMVYCVGLRNISAGLVLALTHFPAATAVPVTLYTLFQQPLASLVPALVRRYSEHRGSM